MVSNQLEIILQDLGSIIGINDLHPDQNNSCLIRLQNGLTFQVEMDKIGEFLIIGSNLGDVPPGRYQTNIFREALKANGMSPPLHGILAFSDRTRHLLLFMKLNVAQLNKDRLAAEINPFIEKATVWFEALKRGDVPTVSQPAATSDSMFGMRR